MTQPTISIILPAYNAEAFVGEALDSILAQTCDDWELIAVNDGSADRTGEILDHYATRLNTVEAPFHPRMTVIHQENQGLAAARNNAIEMMRGRYIALLDADDIWLPEKLQRCLDYLETHDDAIVYTPMDPFDGKTGERMEGHSKPCHAGQLTEKLFMSIFVHDPAAVFEKRVIEECGGFDESIPVSIGNEFWLRVSTKFTFGLIDEPLALRRWSEDSLTRSNRLRGRTIKANMLERFYHERGGRDIIPADKARRRLAKVHYHVGKAMLGEKRFRDARRHLSKAIRYRPGYLKVYAFWLVAMLGSPLG
jgi:glycosyltransferase involved in cell wall biosynthesis